MSVEPLSSALQAHLEQLAGQAGFVAEHLGSGRRLSFNNRPFFAASTIKLPVLAVWAEAQARGELPPEPYHYQSADFVEDSPYFETLPAGTAVSWAEIARQMMIVSDNLATNLFIRQLGLARIQAWITAEGLSQTRIEREMVDLAARARGIDNWTTPADMAQLMKQLVRGRLHSPDTAGQARMLAILHQQQDCEKIPFLFRPPIQVANKPGELPGNRSDVGYVHNDQHEIVMALFCDQLENEATADLWLAELAQLLWRELTIS
jgi:beta-lactamase class A